MLGMNPHQLANSLYFGSLDANSALPLWPTLEVVDRDRLTADDEQTPIRLAEPVVERGRADPQPTLRFLG